MKTHELFSDKIRFVYLQLPYFNKELDDCQNIFERFIFVLKNMDILNRMPWAAQDSVFQKLASIAEVGALNKQERMLYDESLRKFRDTLVVMEGQYMEGEKKGRAEERLAVARTMKANGVAPPRRVCAGPRFFCAGPRFFRGRPRFYDSGKSPCRSFRPPFRAESQKKKTPIQLYDKLNSKYYKLNSKAAEKLYF